MEAMLVRTQLLVLGSRKSPQHKLAELITFMHEALSTIALRELIVCGDILARNTQARIVHKLNSLQNHPDPLALLRNCAWDLYIPGALDQLCAVNPHKEPNFDFYLAELLTFDGDVVDMLRTTQLRALAVHRPTMQSFPFFDHDIAEWLGNRVGGKRMDSLEDIFSPKAFELRAQRRSVSTVEGVLNEDKNRLLHLLNRQCRCSISYPQPSHCVPALWTVPPQAFADHAGALPPSRELPVRRGRLQRTNRPDAPSIPAPGAAPGIDAAPPATGAIAASRSRPAPARPRRPAVQPP